MFSNYCTVKTTFLFRKKFPVQENFSQIILNFPALGNQYYRSVFLNRVLFSCLGKFFPNGIFSTYFRKKQENTLNRKIFSHLGKLIFLKYPKQGNGLVEVELKWYFPKQENIFLIGVMHLQKFNYNYFPKIGKYFPEQGNGLVEAHMEIDFDYFTE